MESDEHGTVHNFSRRFVVVEYPGVVENEEKAIKTLGGLKNISMTHSLKNRRLELRFRPDDAFCKPACADRHTTMSLLLKVKIRRKKNKNEQPLNYSSGEDSDSSYGPENDSVKCSIAVMGRIESAYRFRNLCDFQYTSMLPEFGTHGPVVCKYDSMVPTALPTFSWLSGSAPHFLPPATFSRMDTMQQYLYRREPGDDTATPPNIIGRTRRRRSGHAVFVTFDIKEAPMRPRTIALKLLRLKFLQGTPLEVVRKLFEERPVWSKNALLYLTKYTSDKLKYLLPAVAYYFVTGPWRVMWVRFGYDPRKDPEAVKYQTLDFRLRTVGGMKMKVKAKRSYCNYLLPYKSSPSCRPKTAVITKENLQPEKLEAKDVKKKKYDSDCLYIYYPGSVPPSRQMFYQYCDVKVPEIQDMLEKLPTPPAGSKCHERLGWMPPGMDDRSREIISNLVSKTLKKTDLSSTETDKSSKDPEKSSEEEYEDLEEEDDDDDEEDDSEHEEDYQ